MVIVTVISYIEPPSLHKVYLGFCSSLHAQNHELKTMVFVHTVLLVTCTNHGLETMVLCTVFYGCFLYNYMKRKYIKSKAYDSSPSGKPNIFYRRGARFTPCLHPFVCTQIPLGLRLIFKVRAMCAHHTWTCLILHLAFLFRFSFCSFLQYANV